MAFDRAAVLLREYLEREVHAGRVLLADIAHVSRPLHRDLRRRDRGGADRRASGVLELAVDTLDPFERRVLERGEGGAHEIVAQIREQHAKSREYPWRV